MDVVRIKKFTVKDAIGREPQIGDMVHIAGIVRSSVEKPTAYGTAWRFDGDFVVRGAAGDFVTGSAYFPKELEENLLAQVNNSDGQEVHIKCSIGVVASEKSNTGYTFVVSDIPTVEVINRQAELFNSLAEAPLQLTHGK